jgi:hypothetical protein
MILNEKPGKPNPEEEGKAKGKGRKKGATLGVWLMALMRADDADEG